MINKLRNSYLHSFEQIKFCAVVSGEGMTRYFIIRGERCYHVVVKVRCRVVACLETLHTQFYCSMQ